MIPAPILVLIVNYRTPALTAQAVEAIAPEVRARGDAHIMVVDNGSADGSAAAIEAVIGALDIGGFCSLLALDTNDGFAAGNNAGLEHYRQTASAWPELVWLLNPDTIAEPGALTALVDFLREKPEAGLAGGRCLQPDGRIRPSAFRFHSPLGEFVTALDLGPLRRLWAGHDVVMPIEDRPFRAEWLSGSHLIIRGAVLNRIGLLDSRYFLYFEETDYCARAADAGFAAWHVPASRVVHLGGQSTGPASQRRPRYWFASRARFFLRRYGVARTHLANLLWLIAAPPGALLARIRGRPRRDPPRLWRDFLVHYYGRGGLMYRPRDLAA
ncbi:MAG: glycosyltransferase family 2 protein [Sphingomonadales bacterium]|nr:MAG: glycosyltransferase family 2 protein [Sphingomonadales bacterium]